MASHSKVNSCFLVMVMAAAIIVASVEGNEISAEVRRRLEQLNKPAVKSIESPDGDIIDCVHITKQPAFDHPLLRNHVIQMRPSSESEGYVRENAEKKPKAIHQLWQKNGECPENTVPIRRTKEEDLLRSDSVEGFGKKNNKIIQQVVSRDLSIVRQKFATISMEDGEFYGSRSVINIWRPSVEQHEYSSGQIWISAGGISDVNLIEAGWQVYETLYGDNNTRFFISWTRDNFQTTGCYNLLCSGFVQINNIIALGGTLDRISEYGGTQHSFHLLVWRDITGDWWLQYEGANIGYWPASLFTALRANASLLQWGGEVLNKQRSGESTTTEMGSGHFPEEGIRKAAFFRNIQIVDAYNDLIEPSELQTFIPWPGCYDLVIGTPNATWGTHFFYGGPGRNPHCL